jgi:hypothetical protein
MVNTKLLAGGAALIAAGVWLRRRGEDAMSDDLASGRHPSSIAYSGSGKFPALSGYHPAGALWVIWARQGGNFLDAKIKIKTPGGKWLPWQYIREGSGADGIPYMPAYSTSTPKARYPNSPDRREALEDVKAALNAIGAVPVEWDEKGAATTHGGLGNVSIPLVANGAASFGWDDPVFGQALMVNEIEALEGNLADPR